MAFTAALRSLLIGLIATGLTWLTTKVAVELDVAVISELVGNAIFVVGSGLVAYGVNKLRPSRQKIRPTSVLGRGLKVGLLVQKFVASATFITESVMIERYKPG